MKTVDIVGGNRALPAEILRVSPGARGILFDASHVIDAAKRNLESGPPAAA